MPTPSSPILLPVTEEARRALGYDEEIQITHVPFKIGRESRSPSPVKRMTAELERRFGEAPQLNDVYLLEPPSATTALQISREHCAIERATDGGYVLVDRGSACGTIVAGKMLGGNRIGGRTRLNDGDTIVIGTQESPFVFTFHLPKVELSA
jgi:pSer/pThr/pTyr-binding forkhead associated (FHA) protein